MAEPYDDTKTKPEQHEPPMDYGPPPRVDTPTDDETARPIRTGGGRTKGGRKRRRGGG